MTIPEAAGGRSILFDVDTSSLQPLLSSTNKGSASYIAGLSTIHHNLSSDTHINGCNKLYNNTTYYILLDISA